MKQILINSVIAETYQDLMVSQTWILAKILGELVENILNSFYQKSRIFLYIGNVQTSLMLQKKRNDIGQHFVFLVFHKL